MSQAKQVTAETFQNEVVESKVPVLVDFYANWCGPCRMLGPVLDRVAVQVADRARIVKVDVDEDPGLAGQFNVSSIPCLVLMHHGKVVGRSVGLASAEQLVQMIDNAAGPGRPAMAEAGGQ